MSPGFKHGRPFSNNIIFGGQQVRYKNYHSFIIIINDTIKKSYIYINIYSPETPHWRPSLQSRPEDTCDFVEGSQGMLIGLSSSSRGDGRGDAMKNE